MQTHSSLLQRFAVFAVGELSRELDELGVSLRSGTSRGVSIVSGARGTGRQRTVMGRYSLSSFFWCRMSSALSTELRM